MRRAMIEDIGREWSKLFELKLFFTKIVAVDFCIYEVIKTYQAICQSEFYWLKM
jgi:hypothetical protein